MTPADLRGRIRSDRGAGRETARYELPAADFDAVIDARRARLDARQSVFELAGARIFRAPPRRFP